jgi:hypothetical protein
MIVHDFRFERAREHDATSISATYREAEFSDL